MRDLQVIVRRERSVPDSYVDTALYDTIRQFFPIGFTVSFLVYPGPLDIGAQGVPLTPKDLIALYQMAKQSTPGSNTPWTTWVIIGREWAHSSSTCGVCFDADDKVAGFQREFCAIFSNATSIQPGLFEHTVVHELGHVLNLGHIEGGVMSAGLTEQTNQFAPISVSHLLSHPDQGVIPGGWPFGTPCGDGFPHPGSDPFPSTGILSLTADSSTSRSGSLRNRSIVIQGEPIIVRTKFKNPYPNKTISLERGWQNDVIVRFERETIDRRWLPMETPIMACAAHGVSVAPSQQRQQTQALIFRNRSLLFHEPGTTKIRACITVEGRQCYSRPLHICVKPMRHQRHVKMLEAMRKGTVGIALETVGRYVTTRHRIHLDQLAQELPRTHQLRGWCQLVLGIDAALRFLASGKTQDQKRALSRFKPLAKKSQRSSLIRQEAHYWLTAIRLKEAKYGWATSTCRTGLKSVRCNDYLAERYQSLLNSITTEGGSL